MLKKFLLMITIAITLASCGKSSESATGSDTTVNSITPPTPSDTNNAMAPMMGDTSEIEVDSLKK